MQNIMMNVKILREINVKYVNLTPPLNLDNISSKYRLRNFVVHVNDIRHLRGLRFSNQKHVNGNAGHNFLFQCTLK